MSDVVIRTQGLSKQYRIGERQAAYQTLREVLSRSITGPAARIAGRLRGRPLLRLPEDESNRIWALRNLDVEVRRGEILGLIGRNGAGKSTLLKVLSRITEPTEGFVEIRGRIGSLLEVGTGFHNELTGRENVYLNGAILGMKRAEIQSNFDAIVSFAEVEKFIDTPVKFYSTGMYLRLAFAVAAHLNPDILLVDEVLAVGDTAFQKKCLGRMNEVAKEGRTVLFVSHNLGAVRSLCESGIVLNGGHVEYQGPISKSIETYYRVVTVQDSEEKSAEGVPGRFSFGRVRLSSHEGSTIQQGEPFSVSTTLYVGSEVAGFTLVCVLDDMNQRRIFHLRQESSVLGYQPGTCDPLRINLFLPCLWLEPGLYTVQFKVLFWGELANARSISDTLHLDVGGESSGWGAVMTPAVRWSCEPATSNSAVKTH
ncbi:MAG: ABC transporter ATP-binding protein [Bryobacteraceae bacterium]